MKYVIVFLLMIAINSAMAYGRLDALQNSNSNQLIMAIRDDGVLFTITSEGWEVMGEPCPGTGPFCIQLHNKPGSEEVALIFVIDSTGKLFQTDGEVWFDLMEPPDSASVISLSSIFRMSGREMQIALLDQTGEFYINDSNHSWITPFPTFPATPARDMSFIYDISTNTMNPLVIGSDGLLYAYFDGEWKSTDKPESEDNIQNLETYVSNETGGVLLMAFDDLGQMYSNSSGEELELISHEPCPGTGPWDIKLLYTGNGVFDVMCLDSVGGFYVATNNSWSTLDDSFQED